MLNYLVSKQLVDPTRLSGLSLIMGILVWSLFGCAQSTPSAAEAESVIPPATAVRSSKAATVEPLPESLQGLWAGRFRFGDQEEWTLILADFGPGGRPLTVEIGFPLAEDLPAQASPVTVQTEGGLVVVRFGVSYRLDAVDGTLVFDGQMQDNNLLGIVTHGEQVGIFELAPVAEFGPDGGDGRT